MPKDSVSGKGPVSASEKVPRVVGPHTAEETEGEMGGKGKAHLETFHKALSQPRGQSTPGLVASRGPTSQ